MRDNIGSKIIKNLTESDTKLLLNRINTVGDLIDTLSKLPKDATLNPFGDADAGVAFDSEQNICYIDNIDYLKYDLMGLDD